MKGDADDDRYEDNDDANDDDFVTILNDGDHLMTKFAFRFGQTTQPFYSVANSQVILYPQYLYDGDRGVPLKS